MTSTVTYIISPTANPFTPIGIVELPVEFHVRTPEPHLFSIDTRDICLAADTCTEARVQRVVPDVQLPHIGGVNGGNEIDRANRLAIRAKHLVRDVHDVFVRADAVEWRHDVVRQFRRVHLEAESRMRRAADRALALGPTQRIEAEGWPVFKGSATRVDLLLESQEHQMTGLMRAKARDLDVVVQQIGRTRDEVVSAREEPFLRIESGTPGKGCPDLQVLTERMAHHIHGEHAFGR